MNDILYNQNLRVIKSLERYLFHFDTGWLILIKYAREPTLWAQSVFVNHQHKRSILERQWTMQVCVSRC